MNNKEIICNGKTIVSTRVRGRILEHSEKETVTTSTEQDVMGGASVNGVWIPRNSIRSEVNVTQGFWLKLDDGSEHHFTLMNSGIKARADHILTIESLYCKESEKSVIVSVVNNTTNIRYRVGNAVDLPKALRVCYITGKTPLIALAIFLGLSLIQAIWDKIFYDGYARHSGITLVDTGFIIGFIYLVIFTVVKLFKIGQAGIKIVNFIKDTEASK